MSRTALTGGTRWRGWLRHCATSRKVAGSIPDGVIGIFHWLNPSGRTIALGLTQPHEYQEYFLGGKGGRCVRLTTLPPSCASTCLGMYRDCFHFLLVFTEWKGLPFSTLQTDTEPDIEGTSDIFYPHVTVSTVKWSQHASTLCRSMPLTFILRAQ